MKYAASTWYYTRYNGTGFDAAINLSSTLSGTMTGDKVADVNGDGLLDHIYVDGSNALKFRLHNGIRGDLLTSAVDGLGVSASYSYAPLSNSSYYTRYTTASFPQQDIQNARLVVWQLTSSDGTGGSSTYARNYQYEGARVDLQGRGWLGFAKRTIVNGAGGYNLKTIETNKQDFPYIGLPSSVERQKSSGTRIGYKTFAWLSHSWGSGDTARKFPYLGTSTISTYELDGTSISSSTITANVDITSGHPYDVTTTVTENASANGLNGAKTWTSRIYTPTGNLLNDTTNWCLGKPQQIQQTNSHDLTYGAALTRTIEITWDAVKCRQTELVNDPTSATLKVTTTLGYDSFGNINSSTVTGVGMASRVTQTSYGTAGLFAESATNPLSQTSSTSWNYRYGAPSAVTDANGLSTTLEYDSFGKIVRVLQPDATEMRWGYYDCSTLSNCVGNIKSGLVQSEYNSIGTVVRAIYHYLDRNGRNVETREESLGNISPFIILSKRAFDALGRPYQVSPPVNSTDWSANYFTTYSYDQLGRLVQVARPISAADLTSQTSAITYEGLKTTLTDAEGKQSIQYRDAVNQLVRSQDHSGYFQNFQYDPFDDLVKVDDGTNTLQTSTYNLSGTLTSRSDMDLGTWTYNVNALGEVTNVRDANTTSPAWTQTYTYDALSRVVQRQENEGISYFNYGTSAANKNVGQIVSMSGPGYAESYSYDSYGRLSIRTITADSIAYQYDYAYNNEGRLGSLTFPTSTNSCRLKVQLGYTRGTLSSVVNVSNATQCGSTNETYWVAGAEDGFGHITDESFGNTVLSKRSFDFVTGWVTSVSSGSDALASNMQSLSYKWDKVGNLTERKDANQGGLTETFVYDNLYRLDYSQLSGSTNQDLSYDSLGNITYNSYKPDGVTSVGYYTYHATKKHQVVSTTNGWTFAYDANGNMTSGRGATIQWRSYNLPYSITNGSSSEVLSYTPTRQYWKKIANPGAETTTYVGGALEKVEAGGATDYRHQIQAGNVRIIVSRSTATGNNVYYVTRDHLGGSSIVTNTTSGGGAAVQVNESFGAFGNRRGSNWTGLPSTADQSAFANTTRRGFTDHSMLDKVNLIHMNGRVFDPYIARFISADPFIDGPTNTQGWNRYSYARNRPLSFIDPSGFGILDDEDPETLTDDGSGAIGTIVTGWSVPGVTFNNSAQAAWTQFQLSLLNAQSSSITNLSLLAALNAWIHTPSGGPAGPTNAQPNQGQPSVATGSDIVVSGDNADSGATSSAAMFTILVRGIATDTAWGGAAGRLCASYRAQCVLAVAITAWMATSGGSGSDKTPGHPMAGASEATPGDPNQQPNKDDNSNGQPDTYRIHSDETIRADPSYKYWSSRPTSEIVESLRPNGINAEPLTINTRGGIIQGNTRMLILEERGFNTSTLSYDTYTPAPLDWP